MTASKIVAAAAAGSAGGAALDIPDVFSTYLYTGNGSTQTITNGIDLSGEGGLVWTKNRDSAFNNFLYDTERGVNKYLISDSTIDQQSVSGTLTSFNSNGFTLGASDYGNITNGNAAVSWTFRKAPKFFDVVTYTGNTVGNSAQTISHNLGSDVGFIIVKRYSTADNWIVWHRSITNGFAALNDTGAWYTSNYTSFISSVGSTSFTVGESLNTNGASFVAYVFAHNDSGDGEFGPDSDQDIIKCGSYTGNGSSGNNITLDFEPQFLMMKRTDSSSAWEVVDIMRGFPRADGESTYLRWNASSAEATASNMQVVPSATGFTINSTNDINASGSTWIYMAIRRGPLAAPEDATKVFGIDGNTSRSSPPVTGFVTDMVLSKTPSTTSNWDIGARLTEKYYLRGNKTDAQADTSTLVWDRMNGAYDVNRTGYVVWGWKRAPSYFDVVSYTGTGSNRTIAHNLGVAPEMIWVKSRSFVKDWAVYHTGLNGGTNPEQYAIRLNLTSGEFGGSDYWQDTAPTSSVVSLGNNDRVNKSTETYIAYLFATVPGVSKVGSYTGNGSSQNIDCGFSNGARFVLLKKYSTTGGWNVYDTARGLVAGNDHRLQLEDNGAEITDADQIDPLSSGFTVVDNTTNQNGHSFIFYAIA